MVGIVGSSHGGYSRVLPWWVGYSHLPMVGRLLPSAHGGYIPPARGGYIPPARGGCTFLHPGVEKVLIPASGCGKGVNSCSLSAGFRPETRAFQFSFYSLGCLRFVGHY